MRRCAAGRHREQVLTVRRIFDVVKDPRERANLKDRNKEIFDRLKNDWEAWNDTMLPERPQPAAYSQPGNLLADRYGVTNPK